MQVRMIYFDIIMFTVYQKSFLSLFSCKKYGKFSMSDPLLEGTPHQLTDAGVMGGGGSGLYTVDTMGGEKR